MRCCLGWIAAAFLLGCILGGRWHGPVMLRRRCAKIETFRGRRLSEVTALLGSPVQEEHRLPDGRILRTWRQHGYAITLCFNVQDVCQGVYDECG